MATILTEMDHFNCRIAHRYRNDLRPELQILIGSTGVEGLRPDRAGKRNIDRSPVIDGLIGESELMRKVRQEIAIAASLDLSVLITGEPGTGKELVAKGIHNASSRRGGPFVDINCAEFNSNLIESELFGYENGAFTGANSRSRDQ